MFVQKIRYNYTISLNLSEVRFKELTIPSSIFKKKKVP